LQAEDLLAGCLEGIDQRRRRLCDLRVRRDDIRQAVTASGHIQLLDSAVKPRPELIGAAPASARTQLVRWARVVGALDRPPRQAGLERPSVGVTHACCGLRQRPKASAKLWIGRRQLVRAHRGNPGTLGIADGIPRCLFRDATFGGATLFGRLHVLFLPNVPEET
jgi:hypothetical protein